MGARDERVVQAAAGVIVRPSPRGEMRILLVHRPHREDWTFPKGKLEVGESHERCALREVEEETGLRCKLGVELATSSYINGKGRLKVVRYWIMDPRNGRAEPRNEVDAIRWASLEDEGFGSGRGSGRRKSTVSADRARHDGPEASSSF